MGSERAGAGAGEAEICRAGAARWIRRADGAARVPAGDPAGAARLSAGDARVPAGTAGHDGAADDGAAYDGAACHGKINTPTKRMPHVKRIQPHAPTPRMPSLLTFASRIARPLMPTVWRLSNGTACQSRMPACLA